MNKYLNTSSVNYSTKPFCYETTPMDKKIRDERIKQHASNIAKKNVELRLGKP